MTDTSLLRNAIKSRGVSYQHIARELKITPNTLTRKAHNASEFRASEIETFCRVLHLSDQERNKIFFARKVE